MVRVLQIMAGLSRGGLETFVMNVYRSIDRNVVQFDFLLNSENGDYVDEVKSMGANIYVIPSRNKGFFAYSRNLNSFFKKNAKKYVAVHQHASTLSSVEPLYYAKKYGIGVRIIHAHSSSLSGKSRLHYILHLINRYRIGRIASHFFVCSNKANEWFFGNTSLKYKSQMINNGIDTDKYKFNEEIRRKIRKELGIKEDEIVIGHVGRFMFVKNHRFILEIFQELRKIDNNTKLLLVGTGELLNEIQKNVRLQNLQDSVIFTGVRSDVNELLMSMDIFVMPSLFEGLPMVLVEAQATGLPCICSDTISMDSDITQTIKWQKLSDSAKEWANRISVELKSYERKEQTSRIIEKGFDISTTSNYLMSVYSYES